MSRNWMAEELSADKSGGSKSRPVALRCQVLAGAAALALILAVGLLPTRARSAGADSFIHEILLNVDQKKLGPKQRFDKEEQKALEAVLTKRLPLVGRGEGKVVIRGPEDIRMKVPADKVDDSQLSMLTRIGQLEFRNLDDIQTNLNPHGHYLLDQLTLPDRTEIRFRERETGRPVSPAKYLPRCPLIMDTSDIEPGSAHVVRDGAFMFVRIELNKPSMKRLTRFLNKPGQILAAVLDGEIISVNAVARKQVRLKKPKNAPKPSPDEKKDELEELGTLDIAGGFKTADEAAYLAVVLNSGALPVPLTVVSSKIVAE